MKLKCISTGSSGNCYILTDSSGKSLILDCGVPIMDIKRGLNWNIKDVVGCVVSHIHKDHSKSADTIEKMGIPVWKPYEEENPKMHKYGSFTIQCFQLPHNGTTNYGFYIKADGQKLLYMTDMEYCPYNFAKQAVNHMLIECNYIADMVDRDIPNYEHKILGHCELETCKGIVETNKSDALQNVILCHTAKETCDKDRIIAEIKEIVPSANVSVAQGGMEWELRNADECPF